MDWSKEYFDELYLKYFLETQKEELTIEQVDFLEQFLVGKVDLLDAGCGIGRHSLVFAEHGHEVLGVDSSPLYIERANSLRLSRNLETVDFVVSDIREIGYLEMFDGILSLWSSFGYFDDETNFDILKRFHNALRKEGVLIVDVENKDYLLKYFIYETFNKKDDVFILERRKFNPITSVVTTHRYFVGRNIEREYLHNIRVYTATELVNLFKMIGLKNIRLFGDYSGEKFHINSQRIIIIGSKH